MKTITVKFGQSVFDIALEYYGNVKGIRYLVEDNEGLDLSIPLVNNQKLKIREDSIINQPIVNEFSKFTPVSNG